MKKVTNEDLHGYVLDNVTERKLKKEIALDKIQKCPELIKINIKTLEDRVAELNEALELMDTGHEMYLIVNNDSDYIYADKDGESYEYKIINKKPVLISNSFKMFEIIEYCDVSNIGQEKGSRSVVVSYIHKIMKTKLIK